MAGTNGSEQPTLEESIKVLEDENAQITFYHCCTLKDEVDGLVKRIKSARDRMTGDVDTTDQRKNLATSFAAIVRHASEMDEIDVERVNNGDTEYIDSIIGEVERKLSDDLALKSQNLRKATSGRGERAEKNVQEMEKKLETAQGRLDSGLARWEKQSADKQQG